LDRLGRQPARQGIEQAIKYGRVSSFHACYCSSAPKKRLSRRGGPKEPGKSASAGQLRTRLGSPG
jgi:hypothetical protein